MALRSPEQIRCNKPTHTHKKTRRAAENEDDGDESAIDGEAEESEAEEDEQRPRSSFSGFSGVVPTQTTAPAREPREIRSVGLRATK